MSDFIDFKIDAMEYWDKLLAYIAFRRACEGLWINETPVFWFNILTKYSSRIVLDVREDTGGYMNRILFKVYNNYYEKDTAFEMNLHYKGGSPEGVFATRMDSTYDYMWNYSEGKTWFEKAKYPEYYGEDKDEAKIISRDKWEDCFGPLGRIGRLSKPELYYLEMLMRDNHMLRLGVRLMRDAFHVKGVYFKDDASQAVVTARKWALLCLLDMFRYYHTSV